VNVEASTSTEMAAVSPQELTTVAGFNLEKVKALVDESSLAELHKTMFKRGLTAASDNPEALAAILGRIRVALNM
jgi:hypothetical protein